MVLEAKMVRRQSFPRKFIESGLAGSDLSNGRKELVGPSHYGRLRMENWSQRRDKRRCKESEWNLLTDREEPLPSSYPNFQPLQNLPLHLNPNLYFRESSRSQHLHTNTKAAIWFLQHKGIQVHRVFKGVERGCLLSPEERPVLHQALQYTEKEKRVLVIPTFSRLFRSADYHPHRNPEARPTTEEMKQLLNLLGTTTIYFIRHPDSTLAEEEQFTKKLKAIYTGKGRKQFSRYNTKERREWMERAAELFQKGASYDNIMRQIAYESNYSISRMGIKWWLQEMGLLETNEK